MLQASEPPAIVATVAPEKPPEVVVVSRDAHSDVLISKDTPLALIKAGRTEDALLRQAVFLTSTLTVVRPAAGSGGEVLRWTYQTFLQRQLCFTSMTGMFSCAALEVEELTIKSAGEASLGPAQEPAAPDPAAEAARLAVTKALTAQAPGLFVDDRRLKLDPMLEATGVSIRRSTPSTAAARR